jgi:hypothetical protein
MLTGMALSDRDLKFFRPLWLRVGITAGLAVWCGLEAILSHDQLWIGVTGFGVAYCLYNFFWRWPKTLPAAALPAEIAAAPEAAASPVQTPPPDDTAKQP